MDMSTFQEVIISCHRFNPTFPSDQRQLLFTQAQEVFRETKRLAPASSNLFFPNKSSPFLPVCDLICTEDELLIVN